MLEPLVVKATRAVPRRERRSNPPDLSNEKEGATPLTYPTRGSKKSSRKKREKNLPNFFIKYRTPTNEKQFELEHILRC